MAIHGSEAAMPASAIVKNDRELGFGFAEFGNAVREP
jgi:hypothetical protein